MVLSLHNFFQCVDFCCLTKMGLLHVVVCIWRVTNSVDTTIASLTPLFSWLKGVPPGINPSSRQQKKVLLQPENSWPTTRRFDDRLSLERARYELKKKRLLRHADVAAAVARPWCKCSCCRYWRYNSTDVCFRFLSLLYTWWENTKITLRLHPLVSQVSRCSGLVHLLVLYN